jgi:hypothetical protein
MLEQDIDARYSAQSSASSHVLAAMLHTGVSVIRLLASDLVYPYFLGLRPL